MSQDLQLDRSICSGDERIQVYSRQEYSARQKKSDYK
jgi:hypothetical protein